MALDKVLLGRLLQLNEPWTVRDFRFDPGCPPAGRMDRRRSPARLVRAHAPSCPQKGRNACGDTSTWPAGAAMFMFRHRWVPI
jgi:hypothetical protein